MDEMRCEAGHMRCADQPAYPSALSLLQSRVHDHTYRPTQRNFVSLCQNRSRSKATWSSSNSSGCRFDGVRRLYESGQVIPVSFQGARGLTTACFSTTIRPSRAAASSGLSKKLAQPPSRRKSIPGWQAHYGRCRLPLARWVQHKQADLAAVSASLAAPNFLLKIIPHVDGTARICELVEYHLEDVDLKGAWTGPAQLVLASHPLAPLAELPVLEIVSGVHIVADLTLGLGKVVHDYLT